MKILARIQEIDLISYPSFWGGFDLSILLVGKNVLNNPKAMRINDIKTGDIIFYEPKF